MSTTAGKRSESNHEEVETREWNHVDSQLSEIRVKLTGEAKTGGDTGHNGRDQVVEISIRWVGELEGSHADVVESLVIDTEGLIGVLDQLMNGKGGIVWLDNGIRDLGRWNNRESGHHTVWELLADLGDQERTHTSTSSTTERVGDLETLEAVTSFGLATNDIENLVNKLSTLSVMSLSPVVTGTGLAENEVVGAEELAKGASTDSIHGTWLQIDEDGTGNVLVTGGLCNVRTTDIALFRDSYLVEVNVHPLELKVRRAIVPIVVLAGSNTKHLLSSRLGITYTPEPSRPCSPEMVCLYICQY